MRILPRATPPPAAPSIELLDHIMAILEERGLRSAMLGNERDLRYQQRFDAQTKAIADALQAAKEAVGKAENATERRFESVNEFRQTLADQARDLMPRLEAEQRLSQLSDEIAALRGTSRAGATALLGWIVGAIGLVTGVIALVSTFAAG